MNISKPMTSNAIHVFARIGLLSFGGPAAQIAVMHKELVEERSWLTEDQFLRALSFCMLLPGPEAMQLVTYAGWRIGGTKLGIIAGLLFVLPGAIIILALASLYAYWGQIPIMQALFYGIKAAILVIVIQALIKLSHKALNGLGDWAVAGLSFFAIYALQIPFPLIILTAGLYGAFQAKKSVQTKLEKPQISAHQTLKTIAIWGALWAAPLAALALFAPHSIYQDIALFFSKLAIVTFGGAYAVLAYMTQDVVTSFGWLTPKQMIDALGLAETTPGPLILVTEFVGFLAAMGPKLSLLSGFLGAILTLWVTFIPCFLWIFAGAPYLEWLTHQPKLNAALTAITAAVVGVIFNLALWFGTHIIFTKTQNLTLGPLQILVPDLMSLQIPAALIFLLSLGLSFKLKWGLGYLLPSAALLGLTTLWVP